MTGLLLAALLWFMHMVMTELSGKITGLEKDIDFLTRFIDTTVCK